MAKSKSLDLETARNQLANDTRTDPFVPTVRWYTARDDRFYRLTLLAKQCMAQREQGDEWAILEGRAWLEVGHADDGRSCKRAIAAFESVREPALEVLRWRAHAAAIMALAGNAKGAWERAAAFYRDVLAKYPDDASANLMFVECTRRHVRASFRDSPKMKKVGAPLLEAALSHLEHPSLKDEPLAAREKGLALALLGKHAESVAVSKPAMEALASRRDLANAWYEARMAYVLSLAAIDRTDEAIGIVHSAADDRPGLRFELALVWMNAQQWSALTRLYDGEKGLSAHEFTFYAKALNQQKRFAECVTAVNLWKREPENRDPNDPHVTRALATAKHGLGAHDDAKALLHDAFERGATDAAADASAWYGETLA